MQHFAGFSAHREDPAALRKLKGMFNTQTAQLCRGFLSLSAPSLTTMTAQNDQKMLLLKFQTGDTWLSYYGLVTGMFFDSYQQGQTSF